MSTAPRFDWRSQFAALEPFLRGEGGVVHVHAAPGAAAECFARAVEHLSTGTGWPVPRASARLDLTVERSELAATVVEEIEYAMAPSISVRELDLAAAPSAPLTFAVAERARVRGDIQVQVQFQGPVGNISRDPSDRPFHEAERVERLCQKLLADLPRRRLTLLGVNSDTADPKLVGHFVTRIWDRALSECVRAGLLLIVVFNPHLRSQRVWPPLSTIPPLTLPTVFVGDDKEHAREDLVAQAVGNGWYAEEKDAAIFADTVLGTTTDVDGIYAGYANMLASHPVRQP